MNSTPSPERSAREAKSYSVPPRSLGESHCPHGFPARAKALKVTMFEIDTRGAVGPACEAHFHYARFR
jgi:hypothetical protein